MSLFACACLFHIGQMGTIGYYVKRPGAHPPLISKWIFAQVSFFGVFVVICGVLEDVPIVAAAVYVVVSLIAYHRFSTQILETERKSHDSTDHTS